MESVAQRCHRLLTALEDLAAQEAIGVRDERYAEVLLLQERAAPLVEYLAQHGAVVADAPLRARIAAVLERREDTVARLRAAMDRVQTRLNELQASQRRVARLAPAYGRTEGVRRQLQAAG